LSASLRTSFSVFRVFPLFLFPALQIIFKKYDAQKINQPLADPKPTEETLKQLKINHSQKNVGLILNNPCATLDLKRDLNESLPSAKHTFNQP
jgi:hypothetical protein